MAKEKQPEEVEAVEDTTATTNETSGSGSEIKHSETAQALFNDISKETEYKAPGNDNIIFLENDDENTGVVLDPPKPKEEPINEQVKTTIPAKKLLSPETSAALFVGGVDLAQSTAFIALIRLKLRKNVGDKKEVARINTLIADLEKHIEQIKDLPVSERQKVRLVQKANQKMARMAFTDEESEKLEEGLTAIIQEMPGYQLPPYMGLALVAAQVFIPRLVDVFLEE